jgi:hypothetical protein
MPDLPGNVRGGATTFVLQDKGYVCGGYDGGLLDDLWEFDPLEHVWNLKAYFGGSERKNAIAFSLQNSIAIVGLGKGYSGKKESIYRYYPNDYLTTATLNHSLFTIYPNPSPSNFILEGPIERVALIQCYDIQGKMVFEQVDPQQLYVSYLDAGMYSVRLTLRENEGALIYKIVVRP